MTDEPPGRALVRARRLASGVLLALVAIFVATHLLGRYAGADGHALALVQSMAEAGMVGGLADWFAVTALFRHPLGLKIPHTAIVPARKQRIGRSLGRFVESNFLAPQAPADALLPRGHDRRVRDLEAQRVAEERGDREPVREAADQRRLGGHPHEDQPGPAPLQQPGDDQDHPAGHQQPGGPALHTGEPGGALEVVRPSRRKGPGRQSGRGPGGSRWVRDHRSSLPRPRLARI